MTTPVDVLLDALLKDPRMAPVRSGWAGGTADPRADEMPCIVAQVAERPAYVSVDQTFTNTAADFTVFAVATVYQSAFQLAELIREILHGRTITGERYTLTPLLWQRLDNALVDFTGQMTIYSLPQVFSCNIRRL